MIGKKTTPSIVVRLSISHITSVKCCTGAHAIVLMNSTEFTLWVVELIQEVAYLSFMNQVALRHDYF
jgi:hypothetical protein